MKEIRVIIIEDDPYARDLMTLLLARDWRTRVIGELSSETEGINLLETDPGRVDVIIFDTEIPNHTGWPAKLVGFIEKMANPPALICTATCFDSSIYRQICQIPHGGYLIKGQVGYSLAWATVLSANGHWVMTPDILQAVQDQHLSYPKTTTLVNGTRLMSGLTDREKEIARLAILLNMARRNLADELHISPDWAFEMVSLAYQKLGLSEIISGEVDPLSYLEDNPLILESFQDVMKHIQPQKGSKKGMDMDTLAFHLLTVPDVQAIN